MAAKKTAKKAKPRKAKPSAKKKAPVPNTGGKGFSFEDAVAVRFLLDLLGQTNTLGGSRPMSSDPGRAESPVLPLSSM